VYRAIVAARVRTIFARVSAGEWEAMTRGTAANVRHVCFGDHALSGERNSRYAYERWLRRLALLFPGLEFEVTRVATSGWPWNTWAAAEWVDRATLRDGSHYENHGVTWINVRWGRVHEIREYMDTERVAAACRRLEASGVAEAGAAPVLR
jgi:ketosteroid isomerase-like protein